MQIVVCINEDAISSEVTMYAPASAFSQTLQWFIVIY